MHRNTSPFHYWVILLLCSFGPACKKSFLEVYPRGEFSEQLLKSEKGLNGLLVGAYSPLTGQGSIFVGFGNWLLGSITGGEANKGSDAGDESPLSAVQRFEGQSNNNVFAQKWQICFEGVARANSVIKLAKSSDDPDLTPETRNSIISEARFLRGLYYFELRRCFKRVPFVSDELDYDTAIKTKNNVEIYPKIEEDFQFAMDHLPEVQVAAGRANKWAAAAYLAKVYLYQQKFAEAKSLFDAIILNGQTANGQKYGLLDSYSDLFRPSFDNSKESVFAVQAAVNTGNTNNANSENVLNFPYNSGTNSPAGCCGFFQPGFELVNSFRVDADGLPLPGYTYCSPANAVKNDFGLKSTDPFTPDTGLLDPRLDHSVGRRGILYLDWMEHPGFNWIRNQDYAGPYSPKKFVFYKEDQDNYTDGSSWTRGFTAINQPLIRFADILLMAAECEVEIGNPEKAREYVNQVRARAATPATWVKNATTGAPAANYKIGLYATPWTDQQAARNAVRFERKLELACEGHRFFDLVRWGTAPEDINFCLLYDGQFLKTAFSGAYFTSGKNEYYPIPQNQIDIVGADILQQNEGYE